MSRALATAKIRLVHCCTECGAAHPKWSGRCSACGAWNSLVEEPELSAASLVPGLGLHPPATARPIGEIDMLSARPQPTGLGEFDRVLGGGLVPGSVTLLGGEPGVGKSTLLVQLLAGWQGRTLYVSAEESAHQVRLRAERLGAVCDDLWLLAETSLTHILAAIDEVSPTLVVIDSIQTVVDADLGGSAPGSVAQVRGSAHRLVQLAKSRGIAMVLVGHVTKEGSLAGPRVLEHIVDTVLAFDGDRHHALRLLRAVKHRFGATSELGLWEMTEQGMVGVPDASALFLADRRAGVAGSVVVPTIEGQRPLVVEVQALTNVMPAGVPPRRSAQGIDPGRLALLLAVIERRARHPVAQHEVYASAVGGVRLGETGADLGVCLAVVSALTNTPVPHDLVVMGEVGLAGEIRQVAHTSRRLAEAARLGFARALVPANSPDSTADITTLRARTLTEALAFAGLTTTH
jgi:DNA repair protein RadA/Sms